MEKRYQVFVSSTYSDLQDERRKVIQTLMEMDCIPSGMEIFPAMDEEQWEFIKRVISDCDYYLLIIGERYGSVTSEGISYTEKEYDFAVSSGLKVLVFIHEEPGEIPAKDSEVDPELREKLDSFRQRVSNGRLVKFWNHADQLPGMVSLSLSKTITTYPATGWVRADRISNEEILNEVNELRKKNLELEMQITRINSQNTHPVIDNLARLGDEIEVYGNFSNYKSEFDWKYTITWKELFGLIAPYLFEYPNDNKVKIELKKAVFEKTGKIATTISINDQIYQTIKVQLIALGLVALQYSTAVQGGMALFWHLTPAGKELLFQLRTVKNIAN
jgi:hypothetical protein